MAVRQYTAEQLFALRDSPLVAKPENLPAIEQWIDESAPQTNSSAHKENGNTAQRQRQQRPGLGGATGGEGSPMGSFSTGRPTLGTRSSTLRGNGDDITLGPPRNMFPSSRNVSKLSDSNAPSSGDAAAGDEPESARSRFFSERQMNRWSLNNDKEGKDSRDSWSNVRERRQHGDHDDSERKDRFGRDKDHDGERRNGFGDRHDPRWGSSRDDRRNGERTGGWREREQQRRERDGDRGHSEKEPEWMDEPVVKQEQELGLGMARTQEEFQKWKESMGKKAKGQPEKEEVVETPPIPPPAVPEPKSSVAPLKLDGFETGMFGGWGSSNAAPGSQSVTTPGPTATIKSGGAKPKTSRFASMFKPAVEEQAPAPPAAEDTKIQQAANGMAKTSAEDQEGFNRVLQMLGSTKLGQPAPSNEAKPASPPPPLKAGTNGAGAKPKSRFTNLFEQKSPDRLQSPQQGGVQHGGDSMFDGMGRGMHDEPTNVFGGRLPERQISEPQQQQRSMALGPSTTMSLETSIPFNAMREQQPRPASGRVNEMMFDPPSRGAASPDVNIQNLLAQQRQRPQHTSNESQQLLNLLKKDTSNSRPQSQQALPGNGGMDQVQLHRWLEHQKQSPMPTEPHAPKPRVPQQPPGLFEEQLMRNYSSEQQRQDQGPMQGMLDMPQRHTSQRAPPGFYDEQSVFPQQQQQQQLRRQLADGPPPLPQQQVSSQGRRASGHPQLQMQMPPQPAQQIHPDYHQLTSPHGPAPPPPGFNPHMPRHPPGFHSVNIFQQPQQQQRDAPPPGFGGMQSQITSPANAPPGFFGAPQMPPGYMQQLRSPTDGMPPNGLRGNGRGFDGFDPSIGMAPRR